MSDRIPYGRQWIDDDDVAEVVGALRSPFLTQGPRVVEFESALAARCEVAHAVAVCNGTAALHLACLVAGVGVGDTVLVPPITFVASANAVRYCGAMPRFVDVEPDTGNMDPLLAAAALTDDVRAVVAVDMNGHPADLAAIRTAVRGRDVVLIEDAAHSVGGEYRGRPVGCCEYADMTTMSFHPVKTMTTAEGGAVLTNDDDYAAALRRLREHGIERASSSFTGPLAEGAGAWYHEMHALGYNFRITDMQCALGVSQLRKLDSFLEKRRAVVARYREMLADRTDLILPTEREDVRSAWHLFPVRLVDASRRRAVFDHLRDAGIMVNVHYIPVHLQPYYVELLGMEPGSLPNAEAYYAAEISLPIFPALTVAEQERVVGVLEEALA